MAAEDKPDDKTFTDKAAATAKDVAATAKDVAVTAKEKVVDFVGQHEDKIDNAIDKAGEFVDKKVTKERFTDKIGKAQDVAKGAVAKIAGSEDGDDKPPAEGTPPAE
jgi:antitoxin protein of toxin-antitoxin system